MVADRKQNWGELKDVSGTAFEMNYIYQPSCLVKLHTLQNVVLQARAEC